MYLRDRLKREGKWEEYKIQRNFVTNLIKKKKKLVISDIIKNNINNTKPVWEALGIVQTKISTKISPMVNIGGLSPDELNKHFTSIAKSITKDILDSHQYYLIKQVTTKTFSQLTRFTPEICFKCLKNTSDNKATGHDGISV